MLHLRHTSRFMVSKRGVNVPGSISSLILKCDYFGAKEYNPKDKIDFEVSKDPEDWKYVSRVLPLKMIPEPINKSSYPSGWAPQKSEVFNLPYYIRRSKNHMIPVYMKIEHRGTKKTTAVRNVQGDIWLFASDLHKFVEKCAGKSVGYKVDEVGCKVVLRGDFHHFTSQFLLEKGF